MEKIKNRLGFTNFKKTKDSIHTKYAESSKKIIEYNQAKIEISERYAQSFGGYYNEYIKNTPSVLERKEKMKAITVLAWLGNDINSISNEVDTEVFNDIVKDWRVYKNQASAGTASLESVNAELENILDKMGAFVEQYDWSELEQNFSGFGRDFAIAFDSKYNQLENNLQDARADVTITELDMKRLNQEKFRRFESIIYSVLISFTASATSLAVDAFGSRSFIHGTFTKLNNLNIEKLAENKNYEKELQQMWSQLEAIDASQLGNRLSNAKEKRLNDSRQVFFNEVAQKYFEIDYKNFDKYPSEEIKTNILADLKIEESVGKDVNIRLEGLGIASDSVEGYKFFTSMIDMAKKEGRGLLELKRFLSQYDSFTAISDNPEIIESLENGSEIKTIITKETIAKAIAEYNEANPHKKIVILNNQYLAVEKVRK